MTTKIEHTEWLYRPLLRPASFCTLPEGLSWNYVEIPSEYAADRPDLPISRHRFGIIATTRQLTAKERYTFDLEQVSGPPYSKVLEGPPVLPLKANFLVRRAAGVS